jgi:hypothetical protein
MGNATIWILRHERAAEPQPGRAPAAAAHAPAT